MAGTRPPAGGGDAETGRPEDGGYIAVGHISRAHGIRGELLVSPLTDEPDEVFAPGRTVRLGDAEARVPEGAPTFTVERSRPYKRGLLVKFREIPDRTAAERYVRRYLLIPMEEARPLDEGEVFYHQLLGMQVETTDGAVVGRVQEVYETAPADLLEVKGDGRVHLIPFSESVVREVDVEAGRLVIEPPEGLLEL